MTHRMPTLIRRELWEHRVLWRAPLVVAALLLIGAAVGSAFLSGDILGQGAQFNLFGAPADVAQRHALFAGAVWIMSFPLYVTLLVVAWFYLLRCLYDERKDRSILFWKSMPVSDAGTVISKLLVGMVVTPLFFYVVALVTSLLVSGIYALRLHGVDPGVSLWDTATWFHFQGMVLFWLVLSVLWYAPVAAYLLLVSAWAPRNVVVWAILPPVLAVVIERLTFGTHYIGTVLRYRLGGIWQQLPLWRGLDPGGAGAGGDAELSRFLHDLNPAPVLANVDLWLGLLVAAALLYAVVRIRRYRDDT